MGKVGKMKKLILCLLLSGCATAYQPNSFTGGYSDMSLGNNIFEVSFRGNGFTSADAVRKMFLRRCAEVTLNNGHRYFVLIDQSNVSEYSQMRSETTGSISPNYYGGLNYSQQSNAIAVKKSNSFGLIKTFPEGSQPELSLDAKAILNN